MKLKFPTTQEMAKEVAEKALDEYEYEGKSIRQWVEVLKDYDDKQTTLERIVERLEELTKKHMNNSEKAAELGKDYERHMIFNGAKGTAFEEAIEIVKEEGGI